jgi:hypothetical protein
MGSLAGLCGLDAADPLVDRGLGRGEVGATAYAPAHPPYQQPCAGNQPPPRPASPQPQTSSQPSPGCRGFRPAAPPCATSTCPATSSRRSSTPLRSSTPAPASSARADSPTEVAATSHFAGIGAQQVMHAMPARPGGLDQVRAGQHVQRSVCAPSEPGRQRKLPITNHRSIARSAKRSRTQVLITRSRA